MLTDKKKRCGYCGGTLWQDDDVQKCFMCSRPASGPAAVEGAPIRFSNPKLPGTSTRNGFRRSK